MTMKAWTICAVVIALLAHPGHAQNAAGQTSAATSARAQYLKSIDDNLDLAQSSLRKLLKYKETGEFDGQCPSPSSFKDMYMGEVSRISPEFQKLDFYNSLNLQCLAFVASDGALCNSLGFRAGIMSKEKTATLAKECYANYVEMQWVHGLVTKQASAEKYCREYMLNPAEPTHPMLPPNSAEKACQEISAGFSNPESLCARLNARYPEIRRCLEVFRSFRGNKERCRAMKDPMDQTRCLAFASFYEADKKKAIGACGNSPLCRVMAGDRMACDVYARKAKSYACGLWAARRAVELLDVIERTLDGFEPKSSSAFQVRRERFNKLNREFKESSVIKAR